jgi:periodic tryptophan protein 1
VLVSTGGEANIYVHHDILLPALPLSLAWMNMRPAAADAQEKANMVAVGTMDPGIEIWDLDISDQVEPAATLGGYGPLTAAADEAAELAKEAAGSSSKAHKKKAKAKAKKAAARALAERPLKPGSHSDAVLGLSWNAEYRNVLASGSADSSVKVWDVSTCSCAHTLSHHSDKVQAVAWNPAESPVLLTGSFDRTACLVSWGWGGGEEGWGWGESQITVAGHTRCSSRGTTERECRAVLRVVQAVWYVYVC